MKHPQLPPSHRPRASAMRHDSAVNSAKLEEYIALHNHGVTTGDFAPMLLLFAPDAEVRFRIVAVGPFQGIEAIRSAFIDNPPDDTLIMLGPIRATSGSAIVEYAWDAAPDRIAGTLRCSVDVSGLIHMLEIS